MHAIWIDSNSKMEEEEVRIASLEEKGLITELMANS